MHWNEFFPRSMQPDFAQIGQFIGQPYWDTLNAHLTATYAVEPKIEYSCCSGAPGWNVKYKKGGRSLCVLYPGNGCFTCLVVIGANEATQAELLLPTCTAYTQDIYHMEKPLNGARWLMIQVTSQDIAEDVKKLISTRVHKKQSK